MTLVGKSALFTGYKELIVFSNHFTRLRTDRLQLLPAILVAWLNLQWNHGVFANICNRWIGQSAVKSDRLLALDFPLPPLDEQKRISIILNEQIAAVDRARQAAKEKLEAMKALPSSFLKQFFPQPGQPLPEGWRWVRLGEVCGTVDYGFTASAKNQIKYPKFLRITDIQDGIVDWDKVPGCEISVIEEEVYRLHDGDIVFARTGATTGKSFLIKDPPRSVFASYLIRLRTKLKLIEPSFLFAFFLSPGYWAQVLAGIRGGAQGGFNASMLKKIVLPLPSLLQQKYISIFLKEQLAATERVRCDSENELKAISALPAALLSRAFKGEL